MSRMVMPLCSASVTKATALLASAPMAVVEHDETRADTELGA